MIIVKRLVLGPLDTNCYVITREGASDCIIIDPAYSSQPVIDYLVKNGLTPLAILLTHGHFDHCGGVSMITDKYDIAVYCHRLDKDMTQCAENNEFGIPARNCVVTNTIEGNGEIVIGNYCFKVMQTSGHTYGSVCYFIENYMFSGDTLFAGSIGRTDLPMGNAEQMVESLNLIKHIDGEYIVYPGHYNSSTLSYEKKNNMYLSGVIRFD